MLKALTEYINSVLFPPHCPFCEKILDFREACVCGDCMQKLPFICEPICSRCGKHLNGEGDLCVDCSKNEHVYKEGRAVWQYKKQVSDSLLRFKYHNQRNYAKVYGEWVVRLFSKWIKERNIDVIVPVPIHKSRMRSRGYNQAFLVAKVLGESLNIPVDDESVIRSKKTLPQKELSVFERMQNIQKSFSLRNDSFRGKNILIIDDIYTTGLTVDALSFSLIKGGAKNIYFIALATGE